MLKKTIYFYFVLSFLNISQKLFSPDSDYSSESQSSEWDRHEFYWDRHEFYHDNIMIFKSLCLNLGITYSYEETTVQQVVNSYHLMYSRAITNQDINKLERSFLRIQTFFGNNMFFKD